MVSVWWWRGGGVVGCVGKKAKFDKQVKSLTDAWVLPLFIHRSFPSGPHLEVTGLVRGATIALQFIHPLSNTEIAKKKHRDLGSTASHRLRPACYPSNPSNLSNPTKHNSTQKKRNVPTHA